MRMHGFGGRRALDSRAGVSRFPGARGSVSGLSGSALWVFVALFGFCGPSRAAVTTESILDEMTNLERLTRWPNPAYTCQQASSWDRQSKSPDDYDGWFANADRGQYLRVEEKDGRKEHVMMDADGPGAIVRIWSADPRGTLRIYIDGSEKPAVEAPMQDVLGGKFPGWPTPLAGVYARGWNLYFPIPYAKHCKVTCDTGGFYYHVNYRTYETGADVKSFAPGDLKALADKIAGVAKRLAEPRSAARMPADNELHEELIELGTDTGSASRTFDFEGPAAVCSVDVAIRADDVARAARSVVLLITFDGEKTVECPLGDFFGTAPGPNLYASVPMGVGEVDGKVRFWSHWWMPFAKTAKIELKNLGDQPVTVEGRCRTTPYAWDDRSLHFHAGWRIERDIPSRPFVDWTHLDCKGKGRFVGGALHIINSVKNWWGEGDEKIYVDGEKFPSTFGTGSEDYYGYAWSSPELYTHAYHNQPRCDGPGTYGNNSENRFHILDDIPFTRSFRFDMENWHHRDDVRVERAAVSFWYARPGGSDTFKPITKADVRLTVVKPYEVRRVAGAIEAETMKVVEKTGEAGEQKGDERLSNEAQLRWTAKKPGDRLRLAFDVEPGGSRHVIVRPSKAADYGKVQFYVNGVKAGAPIDLHGPAPRAVPAAEIDLGAFDLKPGENELAIEVVNAGDPARTKHAVGLDYVLVK